MKTEVRMLAQHLGVDKSIVQAPPTDGLWDDGRTDEDQLGASYKELEWAMHQHELGVTPEKFKNREKEVLEVFLKHHNANKHKMVPIPVCEIPDSLQRIDD
jgi:NAD+ synthase